MKYDSEKLNEAAKDEMARLVIERFRQGVDYKSDNPIFQGKSFQRLAEQADAQYRCEYLPEDRQRLERAFGFSPSRYYGLAQIKVNATRAWKRDLVVSNMDNMFTTFPSPNPELDEASRTRIRNAVKNELAQRMIDSGVPSPMLLVDANGEPDIRVKDFLEEQVRALAKVERARLVSMATSSAKLAHSKLRDILVEGDFRTAYSDFSHQQILYGIGFMRFPDMQRRPSLEHRGKKVRRVFKTIPNFRHVDVFNLFPTGTDDNLQTCSAVVEFAQVSKIDLLHMYDSEGYYPAEIEKVLDEFCDAENRNWLGVGVDAANDPYSDPLRWDLDGTIPMLIHEGFLTGRELNEMGITGVGDKEYVNAEIVVVGGRTIKCTMLKSPKGSERTYYGAPFIRGTGNGIWDVLGIAAMLKDTEFRINTLLHIYEKNIDWAARPPILVNREIFANDDAAFNPLPGGIYDVSQESLLTTGGRIPDPMRVMNSTSAQYHLIMSQVQALIRMADEECGIPAFAYGAQDFGRASLGEYSQRMSNALRTVKEAALNEDAHFIEPAFENMFYRLIQDNPELAEGQDINLQVRGLTGLLAEDHQKTNSREVLGMLINLKNSNPDAIDDAALRYGIRSYMENEGFPVDALGISDPTVERAMDMAAANQLNTTPVGSTTMQYAQPHVPTTDGRSGAMPIGTQAKPDGSTNYGFTQ